MVIRSVSGIVLIVCDLEKSRIFYEALGFRVGKQSHDHITFYINWFWIECRLGKPAQISATETLYLKIDNVSEAHARLQKDNPLVAAQAIVDVDVKEITLADPDGYRLVFFEKR